MKEFKGIRFSTTPIYELYRNLILANAQDSCSGVRELVNRTFNIEASSKDVTHPFNLRQFCDREFEFLKAIGSAIGFDYEKKYKNEHNHYQYLRFGLIHKIEETKFFFNQGPESRKLILSSTDCISNIQFMKRDETAIFNVMMRSSDLLKLFALDTINLIKIAADVMDFTHERYKTLEMFVLITSLHLYDEDEIMYRSLTQTLQENNSFIYS